MDPTRNETGGHDHSDHGVAASGGSKTHSGHKNAALCGGEWKYPVTCDPDQADCTYYAKWEYIEPKDLIRFTLTANHTNRWVAIGFGESTSMVKITCLTSIKHVKTNFFIVETASNRCDPWLG